MKKDEILERYRKKSYNSTLKRYEKKRRNEIIILITIISSIILFISFLNSSFVKVENINVEGLVQLEENELIATINIQDDDKIWKIKEEDIANKLENTHNIIKNAQVEKEFLNTLNVKIQEKKLLAQEEKNGQYVKLLEDGQEYGGKVVQNYNLPVLENFSSHPLEKNEILKSLSEVDSNVLHKISEISFDEQNNKIANIYMRDGQRVKVSLVNFSSKLNYYNQIEKFIDDKRSTVLNLVNGAYLETETSEKYKVEKVNSLLNSYEDKQETKVDENDKITVSA
ncbi:MULTISPECIES: cell division protein FtsQ/DivIB [unclassified Gemella]|uniref:cell division protein FtsQ/DivIB n=1 Tax=unclassified Gemella TaxID=2624949 RepID=UPI001073FFFC|nr:MULTISPECIES: FtsQ-type POTRA domain-containing protein [unclassified Gemella]MBF0710018.1 FtsQ-type POTRA domain-containing protein [Gemella sp. GL1.1]MBF0746097.1 FtsQ-type POTRA domain-containing protein [Gemella sp. 19428wG2_WT2a]NYS27362.1 FtsQ-type POTRA domain-containing protein [Gemella sp. GL1]TFU60388.1 FtsQ-type POTRA domain-containing protein [Gemella sp. WT2a]